MRSVLISVSALVFLALEASGRIVPIAGNELAERDQTYRASNGEKFAVEYGFDYHGGDYKEITVANLYDCINYCAAHSSCRAVSYTGKSCWLKSTVEAAVTNSRVTGAVRLQYVPSPITCPIDGGDQLKQADGKKYTVECGTDRPHGDIKSIPTLNFANCIKLSDETKGCIAASWRFGDCYLKESLKPAISNPWVDTAVLSSLLNAPVLCASQSGKQIKEPSGRSFTVACNTDRVGGDMASKPLASFNDCISWCDETNGCIAAAYRDSYCWLKRKVTTSSKRTDCQVAVLSSKLPHTSTHITSTSTKSTLKSTLTTLKSTSKSSSTSTKSTTATTQSIKASTSTTIKSSSSAISNSSSSSAATSTSTSISSTTAPTTAATSSSTLISSTTDTTPPTTTAAITTSSLIPSTTDTTPPTITATITTSTSISSTTDSTPSTTAITTTSTSVLSTTDTASPTTAVTSSSRSIPSTADTTPPTISNTSISTSITTPPPTTTTSPSTSILSTTATTPPPPAHTDCDSFNCPNNDGEYCISNGEYFQISCEVSYGAEQLDDLCTNTLAECIDACSSTWGSVCTGLTYFPELVEGDCNDQDPWDFPWDDNINCFPFAVAQNPYTNPDQTSGWSVIKKSPPSKKRGHSELVGRRAALDRKHLHHSN